MSAALCCVHMIISQHYFRRPICYISKWLQPRSVVTKTNQQQQQQNYCYTKLTKNTIHRNTTTSVGNTASMVVTCSLKMKMAKINIIL